MRRETILVLAALLAPLAIAGALQDEVDHATEGATIRVASGTSQGQVTLAKRVTLRGDGPPSVVAAGPADAHALVVDADGAAARFLQLSGGSDAVVRVTAGHTALLGPVVFDRFRVAIRLDEGAVVLLRNDPSIPAPVEMAARARLLYTTPVQVEAFDARTNAPLDVSAALVEGDRTLATFAREADVPTRERAPDGSLSDPPAALAFVVRAPGHASATVPASQMRNGLRIPMGAEEPLEATALAPSATADAPRVPPAEVAAVVATVAGAAGVGAAAWALGSERRLLKWLAFLAQLYSRLRREKLLDQPTRERIHAHVVAHPGVHYRELQRALQLHNGVLAHHLGILVREKLVSESREGRIVRYHAPGAPPLAPVDASERVFAFVRANPGATGTDVARGAGLSVSLAAYHLQRLADAGRLRRERHGVRVRAFVTADRPMAGPRL